MYIEPVEFKTCCFTGHRLIKKSKADQLRIRLEETVDYLYKEGYNIFLTGGALGFDTLAAEAVLNEKNQYPDIVMKLVIPCREQAKGWRSSDVVRYENIKSRADEIICLSEDYYDGCMMVRNKYIVDNSTYCVCYYMNRKRSGTFYTMKYARSRGLIVYNIAE